MSEQINNNQTEHPPELQSGIEFPVNFIQNENPKLLKERNALEWEVHDRNHEIDKLRAEKDCYKYEAEHDKITGLLKKEIFDKDLEELLSSDDPSNMAVTIIDLDGFKAVNDTLGHLKGDEVLRQMAIALGGGLREGDTLYRIGGDEFAILSKEFRRKDNRHELDKEFSNDEIQAQRRGRLRFAAKLVSRLESIVTGVSVGIATHHPGDTKETIFNRVDSAMYEDKKDKSTRLDEIAKH